MLLFDEAEKACTLAVAAVQECMHAGSLAACSPQQVQLPYPVAAYSTGGGLGNTPDSRRYALPQDLADWRSRMSQQVDSYREELTGLQASLSDEMSGLRGELAAMKARIKQQLDSNARLIGDMQRRDSREAATAASNVPAAVSVANTAQA